MVTWYLFFTELNLDCQIQIFLYEIKSIIINLSFEVLKVVKVTLVKTQFCVYCPSASKLWKELQKEYRFDYEEIDATTPKGQDIVVKFNIMAVPTSIIEANGKTNVILGLLNREKAIKAIGG